MEESGGEDCEIISSSLVSFTQHIAICGHTPLKLLKGKVLQNVTFVLFQHVQVGMCGLEGMEPMEN